jgi:hypothetical protein
MLLPFPLPFRRTALCVARRAQLSLRTSRFVLAASSEIEHGVLVSSP